MGERPERPGDFSRCQVFCSDCHIPFPVSASISTFTESGSDLASSDPADLGCVWGGLSIGRKIWGQPKARGDACDLFLENQPRKEFGGSSCMGSTYSVSKKPQGRSESLPVNRYRLGRLGHQGPL